MMLLRMAVGGWRRHDGRHIAKRIFTGDPTQYTKPTAKKYFTIFFFFFHSVEFEVGDVIDDDTLETQMKEPKSLRAIRANVVVFKGFC